MHKGIGFSSVKEAIGHAKARLRYLTATRNLSRHAADQAPQAEDVLPHESSDLTEFQSPLDGQEGKWKIRLEFDDGSALELFATSVEGHIYAGSGPGGSQRRNCAVRFYEGVAAMGRRVRGTYFGWPSR